MGEIFHLISIKNQGICMARDKTIEFDGSIEDCTKKLNNTLKDKTKFRVQDKSYPPYSFEGTIIAHKVEHASLARFTIDGNMQNQYLEHMFHTLGGVVVYQERVHESYSTCSRDSR